MLASLNKKSPALKDNLTHSTSTNSSQAFDNSTFIDCPYKNKKSKNSWKRQSTINSGHPFFTLAFFMANLFWYRLSTLDKIFAFLFWTTRYCNHSLREIQSDIQQVLDIPIHRRTLCAFFDQLVAQGFLIKHYRFRKNRWGTYTHAHQRNYYQLPPKGRAYMNALIFFAMYGEMSENTVAPEVKIFGTVVKTPQTFMARDWHTLDTDGSLSDIYLKKLYHHECRSYFIRPIKKECQEKAPFRGKLSIDVVNFSFEWFLLIKYSFDSEPPDREIQANSPQVNTQTPHQGYIHPWIKQANSHKLRLKKNTHQHVFQQLGFDKQFNNATNISKFFWAKQPEALIKKCLKLMKKKQAKGYKFHCFEKFLYHLIQTEGNSFYCLKAKLFRSSIDGQKTKLDDGMDTRDIIEKMRQLEKDTGEKIEEKTLLKLMRYSTHMLKRALEAVEYRMKGVTPKDRQSAEATTSKGQPIYETRLVIKKFKVYNPKTGLEKVRERKEKVQVFVGYEDTITTDQKHSLRGDKTIRSWVGLFIYAVKLGSIEAINEKFFKKRLD